MRCTFVLSAVLSLAGLALAGGAAAGDSGTELTGFVDGSYVYNSSNTNGEFGLDQVEIDVIHHASEKTLVRADLEWIKDGEDFMAQVEQAFMSYTRDCGMTFTFGKFNAPIGFELLDPVDMYQFSHALVFDYGLPTNLTGASASKDLGRGFDVIAHVSNGWDRNALSGANPTFGGRLGYTRDGFAGGVSALSGKENLPAAVAGDPDVPTTRTVFDMDLGYETGQWVLGGEVNSGKAKEHLGVDPQDQKWLGFLLMAHVDYAAWTGLTVRYDYFDDKDGWAFGGVDNGQGVLEFQKMQSFTVCPTFTLDDGFGALIELRIDKSNRQGFVDKDGAATDTQTTVAFEMTYSW